MALRPRRGQALSFEMEHICEGAAPGGFCYRYPQREVICTIVIFLQNIVVIGLEKAGQLRRGPSVIIPPPFLFVWRTNM